MDSINITEKKNKSKSNRKGKKQWRKNVELKDVEQSLENLEKEKILFGSKLSEKKDDALFSLDVDGDNEVRKEIKNRRSTHDILLDKRSAVPALVPIKFRNRVKKPKFSAATQTNKAIEPEVQSSIQDLWEAEKEPEKGPDFLDHLIVKPIQRPSHLNETLIASNTEISHPGASYKPLETDHKELKELNDKAKSVLKVNKRVKPNSRSLVKQDIAYAAEEMVQPVIETISIEEEVDNDGIVINKKKSKALTKKDKQKKALRKEMEKNTLKNKESKKTNKALSSVKALKEEVDKSLEKKVELKEMKANKRKLKETLPPSRIGRKRVATKEVEYTADLPKTLRQIKTKHNLFKDQFVNLQRKKLFEPTSELTVKRKRFTKTYTLASHKD